MKEVTRMCLRCVIIRTLDIVIYVYHHHHHLPPWIRSFDLFRHRRIAIVSWDVHDLFFLHGLGRLTCSGIDALPSFPGTSTISSSSMD